MIIRRALYREVSQTTVAIVVVLLVVLVLFGLTAVLGRTARGQYAERIVFTLLMWQTVKRFDLLVPLGFYLGVLLTLSRWYRDGEMTVLAASGIGLPELLRPLAALTLAVALVAGLTAFYLTPLANRQLEVAKAESSQRAGLAGVSPGAFSEAAATGRIVYVERIANDGRLGRVFVSNVEGGRPKVILARGGYPYTDARTGDQFVALEQGWAYEGIPGQADYRIMAFDTYALRLESRPLTVPSVIEALPTRLLWAQGDRAATAEWHWRLSKPLLVPVLAAFALVLAYTDARRGRLSNLFAAILLYFIYSNALGIGTTLLKKGQLPGALGLWWVHLGFALLAFYFIARRAANRPLFALPRPARSR